MQLGVQQVRELGVQQVRELGVQQVRELGVQQVREPGVQQVREPGVQQAVIASVSPVVANWVLRWLEWCWIDAWQRVVVAELFSVPLREQILSRAAALRGPLVR